MKFIPSILCLLLAGCATQPRPSALTPSPLDYAAEMVAPAALKATSVQPALVLPPPTRTDTLAWTAPTTGTVSQLPVTNYEVWSTTNLITTPMAVETETSGTSATVQEDPAPSHKYYDVRAVNVLGLKSPL